MKTHSAQWSVLNELPYWRPVEYCSIELMHTLILGDLKDHSMRFMSLASAGKQLKSIQEKDEDIKRELRKGNIVLITENSLDY